MPHRRHTITVASSTLFFVCLVLHAQARLYSETSTPFNDAEAYRVYESVLASDGTQTGNTDFHLKPNPESAPVLQPLLNSFVALNKTYWELQPKLDLSTPYEFASRPDGIYESMRWRGTSCAWAS